MSLSVEEGCGCSINKTFQYGYNGEVKLQLNQKNQLHGFEFKHLHAPVYEEDFFNTQDGLKNLVDKVTRATFCLTTMTSLVFSLGNSLDEVLSPEEAKHIQLNASTHARQCTFYIQFGLEAIKQQLENTELNTAKKIQKQLDIISPLFLNQSKKLNDLEKLLEKQLAL